ncbi:hypothetical protein N7449_008536 [Penicillium cf. viridicatum]|uniref:Uncharacterized protein n=1 Tax=Penicillium cf. viridicatum TaxID=2972119 RepID=A0A9W9J9P0_9EURO|nr:hypothetical protein N7449_008536 [Penicillium cf. viridicatum]
MGPVKVTYIIFEPLFIRLENIFEAKALQSPEGVAEWWKRAQLVRNIGQSIMRTKDDPEYIPWAQNMIYLDIRLREIVQREGFLNQCEKAEELLDDPKKTKTTIRRVAYGTAKCRAKLLEHAADAVRQRHTLSRRSFLASISLPSKIATMLKIVHEEAAAVVERADAVRSHAAPPVPVAMDIVQKCAARGFPLDKEQEKLCQPKIDVKRGLSGFVGYDRSMLSAYTFGFGVLRDRMLPMLK